MEYCQLADGHMVIPKNKLLRGMVALHSAHGKLAGQQSRGTEV